MSALTLMHRFTMAILLGSVLNTAIAKEAAPAPPGSLVIIGGALRPTTREVWSRVVALAGGPGARIAVFPCAAGEPEKSGAHTVKLLRRYGAKAFLVPLAPKHATQDYRAVARDPKWISQVATAGGVFFTGGEQARITRALHDDHGEATPMLQAIRALHARGGVIAGTSAGAAVMSATMFSEPRSTLELLRDGPRLGKDIAPGLGFLPRGIFADQHFIVRGRFARLIAAMVRSGDRLGLGIDEDSAAVVKAGEIEIIGASGAVLIDLNEAEEDTRTQALSLRNVRLSYLDHGDRYSLATRAAHSGKARLGKRIDPAAADFHPDSSESAHYPNVLGRSVLPELMAQLIDSAQAEVIGLAFDLGASGQPQVGFEFRFAKRPGTVGYRAGDYTSEPHSVFDLRLDVRPVMMSAPLYAPLDPVPPAAD